MLWLQLMRILTTSYDSLAYLVTIGIYVAVSVFELKMLGASLANKYMSPFMLKKSPPERSAMSLREACRWMCLAIVRLRLSLPCVCS